MKVFVGDTSNFRKGDCISFGSVKHTYLIRGMNYDTLKVERDEFVKLLTKRRFKRKHK